jgi:hypothetical protein
MAFKTSPSPDPTSQILGFLTRRLKRQETQRLDNTFNKEAKLDNYSIADTIRTCKDFSRYSSAPHHLGCCCQHQATRSKQHHDIMLPSKPMEAQHRITYASHDRC